MFTEFKTHQKAKALGARDVKHVVIFFIHSEPDVPSHARAPILLKYLLPQCKTKFNLCHNSASTMAHVFCPHCATFTMNGHFSSLPPSSKVTQWLVTLPPLGHMASPSPTNMHDLGSDILSPTTHRIHQYQETHHCSPTPPLPPNAP
jgi:hypothetical protein